MNKKLLLLTNLVIEESRVSTIHIKTETTRIYIRQLLKPSVRTVPQFQRILKTILSIRNEIIIFSQRIPLHNNSFRKTFLNLRRNRKRQRILNCQSCYNRFRQTSSKQTNWTKNLLQRWRILSKITNQTSNRFSRCRINRWKRLLKRRPTRRAVRDSVNSRFPVQQLNLSNGKSRRWTSD